MPQISQSTLDAFKESDEETQRRALSQMSPQAKTLLLAQLLPNGSETPVAAEVRSRVQKASVNSTMFPLKPVAGDMQPESTMGSRVRELALGAVQGLGFSPSSTAMGGLSNLGKTVASIPSGIMNAVKHPLDTAGGIAQSLISGPAEAVKGLASGDYDAMAHGVGGTIATDLPAVYAGTGALNGVRTMAAGGTPKFIEQKLLRGGGSREAQAVAVSAAEKLATDPAVKTAALTSQGTFDKVILQKFHTAEQMLNAAEATIPAGTTIPKAGIMTDLGNAIEELKVPAKSTLQTVPVSDPVYGSLSGMAEKTVAKSISGYPQALKRLEQAQVQIAKLPDAIPFEDLRKLRQQLDHAISTSGGWKETATAADKAEMVAQRTVVNSLRRQLSGISPLMDKANAAYSLAADATNAAGINTKIGRRLGSGAGTPGKLTSAQKTIKYGAEGALAAGGLAELYKLLVR